MSFAWRRDTASHLQPLDQILNQALAPESVPVMSSQQHVLANGVRAGLTPRQAEVLRLVAQGKTDRQIAAELVLSEKTVGRHLENIFTRLGVSSRATATVVAVRAGLV
jgi:DNA-binding NarL/FixJ family response regulator